MTPDDLRKIGHEPMSPLKALRLRCLDCCIGSAHEVKHCGAVKCPSWPFRLGQNPWRKKRQISDNQLAALRRGRDKGRIISGTGTEGHQ